MVCIDHKHMSILLDKLFLRYVSEAAFFPTKFILLTIFAFPDPYDSKRPHAILNKSDDPCVFTGFTKKALKHLIFSTPHSFSGSHKNEIV